jgi:cytochrome c oxidase cbb3-type subunit 4
MSIGLVRGLLTAILFAAFIALWFWAWSKQRKPEFDAAARLPLDDSGPLSGDSETP